MPDSGIDWGHYDHGPGSEEQKMRSAKEAADYHRKFEEEKAAELAALKAEIERLRAIVAKLPQCWRLVDGKPVQDWAVHEGMTYYTFCANARGIIEEQFAWDDYLCRAPDNWCNTYECAEALIAMQKEPEP